MILCKQALLISKTIMAMPLLLNILALVRKDSVAASAWLLLAMIGCLIWIFYRMPPLKCLSKAVLWFSLRKKNCSHTIQPKINPYSTIAWPLIFSLAAG